MKNAAVTPIKEKASTPLPVELAGLTDDVLAALAAEAAAELARRKSKREEEFLASVAEQAKVLGLSPKRLADTMRAAQGKAPDGRSQVRPKYRNPKNHAQTWSGRGAEPRWYEEHVAAAGDDKECVIAETEG